MTRLHVSARKTKNLPDLFKPLFVIEFRTRPLGILTLGLWVVGVCALGNLGVCWGGVDEPAPSLATNANPTNSTEEMIERDYPPVTKVILYNIGVGHMVHAAEHDGPVRFNVPFSQLNIDDSLKSLVFTDSSGGFVRAIEYKTGPNEQDIAAKWLGHPMTLAQLFQTLRGESLVVEYSDRRVEGIIAGVENRRITDSVDEYIVLLTEDGLESAPLAEAKRFHFANEALQKEFRLALAGVAKQREEIQRHLQLMFEGEGKRRIGFAYVIDVPVWRMTYRLTTEDEKTTLQGWAHVDNTSGLDWNEIAMELRSGKPFAFHTDLFDPAVTSRLDVTDLVFEIGSQSNCPPNISPDAMIPRAAGQGTSRSNAQFKTSGGFGGGAGGGGGGFGFGGGGFGGDPLGEDFGGGGISPDDWVDRESARPKASEQELLQSKMVDGELVFQVGAGQGTAGQLVQFKIDRPVTLASGSSAALPVFSRDFEATDVSRFRLGQNSVHPVRSLELLNSTDWPLIPGPVALYRDNAFIGDATLARVEVGESASIDFSIDQAVAIDAKQLPTSGILTNVKNNGKAWELSYRGENELVFDIDNHDVEPRTLVLELPQLEGRTFGGQQPEKTVGKTACFRVSVPAQESTELRVKYLSNVLKSAPLDSTALIQNWLAEPNELEEAVKERLRELIRMDEKITAQDDLINKTLKTKRADWIQIQGRARENYNAIQPKQPDKAQPYLDRIMEAETSIASIDQETVAASALLDSMITERDQMIASFQ